MAKLINPYRVSATEPNMREEMRHTMHGFFPEIAKGRTFLIRARRVPLENNICSCVNKVTHEPDKSTFCPYCWGEGYYWDEYKVAGYKEVLRSDVGNSLKEKDFGAGYVNEPIVRYFIESKEIIFDHDKLVELETDKEGNVVFPYKRTGVFHITSVIEFRSDYGKSEYIKLLCYKDQVKFLNGKDG